MKKYIAYSCILLSCISCSAHRASNIDITGIWPMHPLRNGIANVTAYDDMGVSYLYPFVCSWKDGAHTSEDVILGKYKVDVKAKKIHIDEGRRSITMSIIELTKDRMILLEDNGREFKYYRQNKIEPLCNFKKLATLASEIEKRK